MGVGGGETWGEGGAQKCVGPILVYLEGQCGHLCHCNPEQKTLTNYKTKFARIQLAKVEMLALLHIGHFPKIYPNQLLWPSWQLGKYGMGIMSCEAGCLVPPWGVKSGVNVALLQHHILSANSEKKQVIEALVMLSLLRMFDFPWFFDGRWVANWLPSSQPQPKEIQKGISRHQFDIHH